VAPAFPLPVRFCLAACFPVFLADIQSKRRSASIAGEGVETSECCWKEAALFATLTRGPDTLLYRTIDSKRFLAHAASIASRTSLGDSLIRKFQHRALLFNRKNGTRRCQESLGVEGRHHV